MVAHPEAALLDFRRGADYASSPAKFREPRGATPKTSTNGAPNLQSAGRRFILRQGRTSKPVGHRTPQGERVRHDARHPRTAAPMVVIAGLIDNRQTALRGQPPLPRPADPNDPKGKV